MPRSLVAVSEDGSRRAYCGADGIELGGETFVPLTGVVAAAWLPSSLWLVVEAAGRHALHRLAGDGTPVGEPVELGALGDDLAMSVDRSGIAVVEGNVVIEVRSAGTKLVTTTLGPGLPDRRVLVTGRGIVERRGPALVPLRAGSLPTLALPSDTSHAVVTGGWSVLDGAAIAVEVCSPQRRQLFVFDARTGTLRSRIRLGDAAVVAVAERRGLVVLGHGPHLATLDLRVGRCSAEREMPGSIVAGACDVNGSTIVVVDERGERYELGANLTSLAGETEIVELVEADDDRDHDDDDDDDGDDGHKADHDEEDLDEEKAAEDDDAPFELTDAALDTATIRALRAPTPGEMSPALVDEYLTDLRSWVAAKCRRALAVGWDTGRFGSTDAQSLADALLDPTPGRASQRVTQAREAEAAASGKLERWSESSPHVRLATELGLSSLGIDLLVIAAAPQLWSDLGRIYRMLGSDAGRPVVTEILIADLLEANVRQRAMMVRELDRDAALVRSGAMAIDGSGAITVDPVVVRRLAGESFRAPRRAGLPLSTLIAPRDQLSSLISALDTDARAPVRVVLRGRPGSGRLTLAAVLAAKAGRALVEVELARGGAADLAVALAASLRDAALRGWLPCVTLDELTADPAVRAQVRDILDHHPASVIVRMAADESVPLAPGYHVLDFAPLDETGRRDAWTAALEARGLATDAADQLAGRFAITPGVIARACDHVVAHGSGVALGAELAAAVRQHRSARLDDLAVRVDRLASWDELVLPDEMVDGMEELVSRVAHRRTVLESWRMASNATAGRGVTALFQGGPGSGKTMAAGVIARALGFELWRVDLSKVMSRWLGETERNLGKIFDAAEDGEIVLLFDEADSLFSKRTEVKSSHDRYANLETNYLLQRLDQFGGVAVLTTNFGSAIDPAFSRRMSLHLQFGFPDEADRERLWAAHLPDTLPRGGELDLVAVAHTYQLSGGRIRNAAMRAAYLAAAGRGAIDQATLLRAIRLEYASQGKLGTGRLD